MARRNWSDPKVVLELLERLANMSRVQARLIVELAECQIALEEFRGALVRNDGAVVVPAATRWGKLIAALPATQREITDAMQSLQEMLNDIGPDPRNN
ncbi:MAG TPA: hypothetical protein VH539_06845 [Gemmatimonadaceae bacterium]|jgi:hypothetical protein